MRLDAKDRAALLDSVREAAAHGPREFLAEDGRGPRDDRLWKVLAGQIGLAGLLVPEHAGGVDAGISEVAGALEVIASRLAVVPALSSLGMATALLRLADTSKAAALMARLCDGSTTASVVWPALGSTEVTPTFAAEAADPSTVTGRSDFVLEGAQADVLIVPVELEGRTGLMAVEGGDERVARTPLPGLDLTREIATVELAAVPAAVIADDFDLTPALDMALVLISAEQVGIAQHCHDTALSWAKERVQFDRPIGQFQAIKHLLADLYMDLELARSSLDIAVDAADAYLADPVTEKARKLRVAASVAKARCGEAAMHIADESLHVLGGIGFTWEHDAHLYYRRAKVLELLFGDPATHRDRFARLLLDTAGGDAS